MTHLKPFMHCMEHNKIHYTATNIIRVFLNCKMPLSEIIKCTTDLILALLKKSKQIQH